MRCSGSTSSRVRALPASCPSAALRCCGGERGVVAWRGGGGSAGLGVESEAADTPEKLRAAETQCGGGPGFVAIRPAERLHDHLLFHLGDGEHLGPPFDVRDRNSWSRDVARCARDDAELPGRDQLALGKDE